MTSRRDLPGEMADPRLHLDERTADRLLGGRVAPDDAPPGYAEVAGLLQALAAETPSLDPRARDETVRAMTAVFPPGPAPAPRRSDPRRLAGRLTAIVLAGSLVGTGGAAVAGGLPDEAQRVAADLFDRIGITIPSPEPSTVSDSPQTATDRGDEISSIATGTDASGVDKGAEVSDAASDGKSQAGEHGGAGTTGSGSDRNEGGGAGTSGSGSGGPPGSASNGGTGAADEASGDASEAGTGTANERSGGHSSTGSSNVGDHPSSPDTAGAGSSEAQGGSAGSASDNRP